MWSTAPSVHEKTMSAWAIERYGEPRPREMKLETPKPGPQDVLIRMRGAEVGDWDGLVMSGEWPMSRPFPIVLGLAGAGYVAGLGKQVQRLALQQPVYVYHFPLHHDGCPANRYHNGAWAEFMLVPETHVASAPSTLDLVRAGALPIAGLTAHETLVDILDVGKGDVILVTAAAGGVGHLAVQIAARRGAHVIATARKEHHDFLRELGANEVIDYTEEDFVKAIHRGHPQGVDKALNGVGGDTADRAVRAVRAGGHIVDLTGLARASSPDVRVDADYAVKADGHRLKLLADMIDAGELRLEIEQILPLQQALTALATVLAKQVRGKMVLSIP
jgi:NADPH:quinone reductase-like Zn-dependent oxidoreductase